MTNSPLLSISRRTRITPFHRRIQEANVKAYTVYNHMLLPTIFESVEEDYHHLKKYVQVWDVSIQRQVEIQGKDAADLVQKITPRSLTNMRPEQCYYAPLINKDGGMLNDPVILKISEDHYWLSLADSDILFWVAGLVEGFGIDVYFSEPNIFPLAVQAKAENLMASVFGEIVRTIKFFRFKQLNFQGVSMLVSRSGWSKQGGFEIFLPEWNLGEPLWDALFEAGKEMNVRVGCPNLIERIEGGLLSYGTDMTQENTPYECGLEKLCDEQTMKQCIGGKALKELSLKSPKQSIRGFLIEGEKVAACYTPWLIFIKDKQLGQITSAAWSPDFETNVAIGMVKDSHWENGTVVFVRTPNGDRQAKVCSLPFVKTEL